MPVTSEQIAAAGFPSVAAAFDENFSSGGELGASLSVRLGGLEVISLAAGHRDRERRVPWTADTPIVVWSTTKGVSAATLHAALHERGIGLETRVADLWPEFARAGKERITLAEAISHRAGVRYLDRIVAADDHPAVVAAIGEQAPVIEGHGYHPRTIGYLFDEILRRATGGEPLGAAFRRLLGDPLELDFWIGAPPGIAETAGRIYPPRELPPPDDPFARALGTPASPTARAFASPGGLSAIHDMNQPANRAKSLPAFGGIGTAASLSKLYAHLLRAPFVEALIRPLADGPDPILLRPTAFSAGFMKDPVEGGVKIRQTFGPSRSAFGHPGAGGGLAFADPENDMAFAYVMNQMAPGVLPGPRPMGLVAALYRDLGIESVQPANPSSASIRPVRPFSTRYE
jgi:CubicO group peptidase (beta-lactamase class C family)